MIPREHDATVAVDAVARAAHDKYRARAAHLDDVPEFDDLEPTDRLAYREAALPLVWVALEALPEPPAIPAGLFVDDDGEGEACVWQAGPDTARPVLVARRCDLTPTAWATLEAVSV